MSKFPEPPRKIPTPPRPMRCGKWQEGEFPHVYKCSVCGRYTDWISHGKLPPPPFCCWCGAKMENYRDKVNESMRPD